MAEASSNTSLIYGNWWIEERIKATISEYQEWLESGALKIWDILSLAQDVKVHKPSYYEIMGMKI